MVDTTLGGFVGIVDIVIVIVIVIAIDFSIAVIDFQWTKEWWVSGEVFVVSGKTIMRQTEQTPHSEQHRFIPC